MAALELPEKAVVEIIDPGDGMLLFFLLFPSCSFHTLAAIYWNRILTNLVYFVFVIND